MSMQAAAQSVSPDSNPTMHSITTAALGAALASILGWVLQLYHIVAPPEVIAAFGVVGTVVASLIIRKIAS